MRRGEKRREKQQSLEECLEQARNKRMRLDDSMLEQNSQDVLVCSAEGPSPQFGEGAPLNQINTRACGDNCQAELQCSRRDDINMCQAEQNCNPQDERGQAEHCSPNNISSSSSKTHSTRHSPTIPGAVARYVVTPVRNIYLAKITNLKLGNHPRDDEGQAEHQCSLIEDQDEMGRVEQVGSMQDD